MRIASVAIFFLTAVLFNPSQAALADDADKLVKAAKVLSVFTADEAAGIPAELMERAHGVAVIPGVIRGGIFIGGRRGRGVLTVRTSSGEWSNPAFITLTGGSIGPQFGAESSDVVLVFANPRSVRNIEAGRLTFGGDAAAVAGPLGRRSTSAVTAKSEVYIYVRGRGLFAGAAFEGARLDVDQDASTAFYAADENLRPFGAPGFATPASAIRFLDEVRSAAVLPGAPPVTAVDSSTSEEAKIYAIE